MIATVTANHIIVNLKNEEDVKIGDEATLISNEKEGPTASELSVLSGLSVYKILIGLNPTLKREYIRSNPKI